MRGEIIRNRRRDDVTARAEADTFSVNEGIGAFVVPFLYSLSR